MTTITGSWKRSTPFIPGIPDVDGKKVVAQLYRQFGLTIFQDMYERANKISEIESAIQEQKRQLEYVTRAPLRSILA